MLSIVSMLTLFKSVPRSSQLTYTEGQVISTKLTYTRQGTVFVVLIANSPFKFQPKPPLDLPKPISEIIKPGVVARIGHTEDTMGMFGLNNNLVVYSLSVNGRIIYTLDEYRGRAQSDQPTFFVLVLVSAVLCLSFAYWHVRQRMKALALSNAHPTHS